MKPTTVRLQISGLVQGVCFRHYTRETALENGVSGWVRNCSDGTVEALLQGDEAAVNRVIHWCQAGPPAARVDKVEVTVAEPLDAGTGFRIRS